MHRLRIFMMPLLAGNILYAFMNAGLLSGKNGVAGFCLLWAVDIFTLPIQGKLAYRHGLLGWAAACHAARFMLTFGRAARTRLAAEIAWILQDLDRDAKAALWLSLHGEGSVEREPLYAASLARYLLRAQAKTALAMDLADTALQGGNLARAHYVRGLCYLDTQDDHSAIASFETARQLAAQSKDFVLAGFCYLGMGKAWSGIGEREYSRDHLLRAEIMLSFLPKAIRNVQTRKDDTMPDDTMNTSIKTV